MASSRRAARALQPAPELPPVETDVRRRRTAHETFGFRGIITWENGVPVRVWDVSGGAAIEGAKAREFVQAMSLRPAQFGNGR
ncbi:hypothetical protein [Arthrobacter sp. AL12]|uniref:hypothetical protein n=1 Tax=Arthrobacter sp. AL12 TaxID=3042241 RepID=UPI00249CEBE6|nr:hypothetical protein [Arthrobacter sp. AL12]MDI3211702.1 hypothetical protein [Arthrobacter sp. AL12]